MGNRGVITTEDRTLGLYLHWNGSRDFVEPFLAYCGLKRYRPPSLDMPYGYARLAQVIGNFFGGGLSVGVVPYTTDEEMLAGLDNGVYVTEGWNIKGRLLPKEGFRDPPVNDMQRSLHCIDSRQPAKEQLRGFIDAHEVAASDLRRQDQVWVYSNYRRVDNRFQAGYVPAKVRGIGCGELGGTDVDGVPYTDAFSGDNPFPETVLANYLFEPAYRLIRRA